VLVRFLGLLFLFLTVSCSHTKVAEQPLEQWTPETDSEVVGQIQGDRSPQLAVMLSFSGGGTRASALSYGVLKELEATRIHTEKGDRALLHEVDIISSVSGGSFTAAYYGLYGDRIFDDFDEKFLRKNVEGELFLRGFNPINWVSLLRRNYGRSDLAADYYNKHMFDGATFADMQRQDAPLVIMNATDLASGARIPFFKGSFDIICTDLDAYPVSRAVAASSAAPVILSPIALKSHAGECQYQASPWIDESLRQEDSSERKMEAELITEYMDQQKRPWLHLVDGGISDNLGLRAFYNTLGMLNDPRGAVPSILGENVRNIIIISVNAHANHHPHLALKRYAPSFAEIVSSVTSEQMSRYSQDTIRIIRYQYENLANELSEKGEEVNFFFVEVSFDRVRDKAQREYLNSIPTNFNLSDDEVDKIVSAAGRLLRESDEFQSILKALAPSEAGPDQ
jgi:NTE family protein